MSRDLTRRDFLARASAATLSALAAGGSRVRVLAQDAERIIAHRRHGHRPLDGRRHGAHRDVRPEALHAVRAGLKPEQVLCTFPAIDTAVDNIKFSQGLEQIASVMDRGTLIRSYTRRRPRVHPALAAPVPLAHRLRAAADGRRAAPRRDRRRARSARATRRCRAFINIGQRLDVGEGEELKAFTTAGFLGSEYGPFNVPFPTKPPTPCARPAA